MGLAPWTSLGPNRKNNRGIAEGRLIQSLHPINHQFIDQLINMSPSSQLSSYLSTVAVFLLTMGLNLVAAAMIRGSLFATPVTPPA